MSENIISKSETGNLEGSPKWLSVLLQSYSFNSAIILLLIIDALLLAWLTPLNDDYPVTNKVFKSIDSFILYIFVVEMFAKIYCFKLNFFKSKLMVFDAVVIMTAFIPAQETPIFSCIIFLRTLRILGHIKSLNNILAAMFDAIFKIGSIAAYACVFFYIYSVVGVTLFGQHSPYYFGSFSSAWLSLFQVMTLEGWPDIARPIIDINPFYALYFVTFIMIICYVILNVVLAILVDSFSSRIQEKIKDDLREKFADDVKKLTELLMKNNNSNDEGLMNKLNELSKENIQLNYDIQELKQMLKKHRKDL